MTGPTYFLYTCAAAAIVPPLSGASSPAPMFESTCAGLDAPGIAALTPSCSAETCLFSPTLSWFVPSLAW
jgi:hypothetical protein